MLRKDDLSKANGLVGMTTFLSIIFGTALAGPLKDFFTTIDPVTGKEDATGLWRASFVCVVIAILGTLTSLLLRKPPPADRTTPLTMDALAVPQATRTLLVRDLPLTYALLASCAFWLIAGLALQSVNALGKTQLGLSDTKTSLMTSIISLGIAAGAVVAGYMSRRVGERRLVKIGNWGVIACCIVLSITVPGKGHLLGFGGSLVMLVILGAAAALFAIPVQVFIQSRPPEDMKGRTIAFMNQANFAAIVLAGIMYMLMDLILLTFSWPRSAAFAMMAIVYVPVALFYSLPSASAES